MRKSVRIFRNAEAFCITSNEKRMQIGEYLNSIHLLLPTLFLKWTSIHMEVPVPSEEMKDYQEENA